MSISSQITRIKNNIAAAYAACDGKGATMPATENSANLADTVASIPSGGAPTLITKQITVNGTYSAEDDNADGYSEVTVDVSAPAEKDINFYDYDGTLVYSYTFAEAELLQEMPVLPMHEGLIGQEWNYTIEQIRTLSAKNFPVNVSAFYNTANGCTNIYISNWLKHTTSYTLRIQTAKAGSVFTIDWGDGSPTERCTSLNDGQILLIPHTYSNYFKQMKISILSSGEGRNLITFQLKDQNNNITRIEYNGGNIRAAAANMQYLSEIVCSKEVDFEYSSNMFSSCYKLKHVAIPYNTQGVKSGFMRNCYSARSVSIPYGCNNVNINSANALHSVTIPYGVSVCPLIKGTLVEKFVIPDTVTTIGENALSGNPNLIVIDLSLFTDPNNLPALGNTNAFPTTVNFYYVANQEMLNAFEAATNWSAYAGKYVIKGVTP